MHSFADTLRVLEERTRVARTRLESGQPNPNDLARPTVKLPQWDELERAIPNHIARSSLYAPVARGRRKLHDGTELTSRSDVAMRYWGKQLDEPDCDVWMQALHEVRHGPLGLAKTVNRASFLRSIGRHTGSSDYNWLHESLLRLSIGMLEIKTKKYAVGDVPTGEAPNKKIHRVLHLIDGFDFDEDLNSYTLRIDPRMVKLFSNHEYSLVDWDKRLRINRGQDMAKSLQRLVATSSESLQRHSLHWLKQKMQYGSPMRKFRLAVSSAMAELERVEVIVGSRIEVSTRGNDQAVWTRL